MQSEKHYRYYCLHKDPCCGTVPRGMSGWETFDQPREIPEINATARGWVEYLKPLRPHDVIRYGLAAAENYSVMDSSNVGCNRDYCEF